jgi:hypothetical protein
MNRLKDANGKLLKWEKCKVIPIKSDENKDAQQDRISTNAGNSI